MCLGMLSRVLNYLVLVRIEHVRVRKTLNFPHALKKCRRMKLIVMVTEHDIVAVRKVQRSVGVLCNSKIVRKLHIAHPVSSKAVNIRLNHLLDRVALTASVRQT